MLATSETTTIINDGKQDKAIKGGQFIAGPYISFGLATPSAVCLAKAARNHLTTVKSAPGGFSQIKINRYFIHLTT